MARLAALAALLVSSFALTVQTDAGRAALVEPAIERFFSSPNEPLQQYRAVRRLEGSNARFSLHGTLEALTELTPDGRFTYRVIDESGSEYIRNRVLRRLLDNEEQVFASGDPARADFTLMNYAVHGGEPAGADLVKLFVKPRRADMALVDGAVFVTSAGADLVRVEGRLAKNPSFWTTRVDMVRQYGRIEGIRVPLRLDTTAQVRLAGPSALSVTYHYEMINGLVIGE